LNTHSIAGFKHFATTQNSLPNFTTPISPSVGDSFQYTFPRNIYRKAEGGRRLLFDELNSYKPNLTVITVVFNNVKLIEQTIQSVINQQGSGLEYILIDGGSTDGTIELIQKYNEQLTYWISEPDCGISEAFNKAILLTRNCWINFMNSGDYFLRLDILSFLEKSRNQNKIISGFCRSDGFWLPSKILNNQQCITRRAKLSHQATFIEKNLFTQYGVFDTRFQSRMDYHFWMKVLPYEKFFFIKENIAYYQKVGESNKNLLRMYKEELIINFESLPFSYFLIRSILIIGAFFYKTFVSRYR
jgi:glycosyltransferase involved in cell wall biosynthesis